MDRKKILATATALFLTVTGGVSALFLTVGAADTAATPVAATEIVEYVDAAGNPIPAASAGVTSEPSTGAEVGGTPAATAPTYADDEEEEDDDHREEHEDEDHDEHEEHDHD
jgi:hypothetical protein